MVMFHTIPYVEAKRRGAIQEEILDELTSGAASLDEVDLARADRLIAERLLWHRAEKLMTPPRSTLTRSRVLHLRRHVEADGSAGHGDESHATPASPSRNRGDPPSA
jgi:hypothetical protein